MQAKSYLDRQNGKRGLEGSSGDEGQPDRKRPALASVIVEALKVDSLQKLCSSLEPILRRVVSEEVERALAKLGPAKLTSGSSPKYIQGPDGRNLQMHFRSRLSLPLFTGGKVEGEQGTAIHIVLIDANTGHVVTSGPESSAKLDVVVLEGDFNNEDDETWTAEEFESHVVKEREGKRPLLTGDLQVTLKEGVGTLGELSFTDNSSWIRSRKFRLGLKVASGCCQGVRIREGKTDAFTVKDHRGELYKKHYPPALTDEVWRLEKIGKDGSFHKRLNKNGIYTVEDFLRLVVRDLQKLRNILGSGMSNKMWDFLFEHAKTCVLGGKVYVYYAEDAHNIGVVFNNIYELRGLIADGQYHSADSLSDNQKVYVDGLVKRAYDNWSQVVEYDDGNSFMDFKSNESAITSQNDVENDDVQDLLGSYGHQQQHQAPLPSVPVRVPQPPELRQPTMAAMPTITGYNNISPGFVIPSHDENLNASFIFDASPAAQHPVPTQHQQYQRNDHLLALGPPQASTSSPTFHQNNAPPPPPSNLASHRGLDDFFTEEEIRLRSHEMLENDDMQNLLRIFNMGGGGSSHGFHSFGGGVEDGSYPFPSTPYLPNPSSSYGFGDEQSRSSGKAVVGWLKLKAALRWGIFIRKKAAERRAQLVELDD